MGLEKAIKSGKEHRRPYKYRKNYCKSVDERCKNNGGRRHKRQCLYCLGNRTYQNEKELERVKEDLKNLP